MTWFDRRMMSWTAGWLAFGYFLFFALPPLWGGIVDGDGGALIGAFLLAPWFAAPIAFGAGLVATSPTRTGATAFFLFELALISGGVGLFVDTLLYGNSTAAVGLMFIPLFQWVALVPAFLIALALGWRMRPDFLLD